MIISTTVYRYLDCAIHEVKFSKERVELCLGCDSVFGPREGGLYLFPLVNLVSLSSPFPTVLNIGSETPYISSCHPRTEQIDRRNCFGSEIF